MADEDRFKIGRCYFLVGYYDARLTMPKIKTLIFLGKKHLEDGSDECWCFGTPQSMEPPGKVEVDQSDILNAPRDLLRSIHDLDDLIRELTENKKAQDRGEVFQGIKQK